MATRPDKRFATRLAASAGDYVVYVEGSGTIRDISIGGVFIQDKNPLPEGTVFGFTLRIDEEMLPLKGVVRRSIARTGMGIQFQDLNPDSMNKLERVLNRKRIKAGKE